MKLFLFQPNYEKEKYEFIYQACIMAVLRNSIPTVQECDASKDPQSALARFINALHNLGSTE